MLRRVANSRVLFVISVHCAMWVSMSSTFAQVSPIAPQSQVASCAVDLDGDNRQDLVLHVISGSGFETIALLRRGGGYRAYLLRRGTAMMQLSCNTGSRVSATVAGPGSSPTRVYQTPGAYVSLRQPEGAAVSYIWSGRAFLEVWIAD